MGRDWLGVLVIASALAGCDPGEDMDDTLTTDDTSTTEGAVCSAPVAHPHDPSVPEWSYHGEGGPASWGSLPGYELCEQGRAQTPIDIVTGDAVPTAMSELPLAFVNYDRDIAIQLLDNGHTLQVVVPSTRTVDEPHVVFDGTPYWLVQFHHHSTSEHTIDGVGAPFEVHFVHASADDALLVVGVLLDDGDPDPTLDELLANDPGHGHETTCSTSVRPDTIVPVGDAFYHYAGSLTTPGCSEGVQWFVASTHETASVDQSEFWQETFEGTTNRPIQPLNGRTVTLLQP
jgi:carbonic anhydrase